MSSIIEKAGLNDCFEVDSAGTASYHIGRAPDSRMIAAGTKRGLRFLSVAKAITRDHITGRDLVIAMDRENAKDIQRISGMDERPAHLKLLSDYLGHDWPRDVPDPYYGDEAGFEYVLDMLEAACPKILVRLQA
jgi:protein-tyrosine phosphatase